MGNTKKKRDVRPAKPPRMEFEERDGDILKFTGDCRVVRQDQIHKMFFGNSKSASTRRLALLFYHGFLQRLFLPVVIGRSPTLYVLDHKGADFLRSNYGYDIRWYPSSRDLKPYFLDHALAINEVRIAVSLACRQPGYELKTWLGESFLKANYDRVAIETDDGLRAVSLIPDSFFALKTPQHIARFFLELDRGTETTGRFQSKVKAYLAYCKNDDCQRRYRSQNMRVLTVVTGGEKRLADLKHVTEQAGGSGRFWFSRATDLSAGTILHSSVWQKAGYDDLHTLIEPK